MVRTPDERTEHFLNEEDETEDEVRRRSAW